MFNGFSELLGRLENVQEKSLAKQHELVEFIENIDYEPQNETSKVSIEISSLEDIAARVSEALSLEKEKKKLISQFEKFYTPFTHFQKGFSSLKSSCQDIKNKVGEQLFALKNDIKRISSVLKEYKERCRGTLLYYLKSLDHDIRRILKPLVPNTVLSDQIKYPPINKGSSLISVNSKDSEIALMENPTSDPQESDSKAVNHLDLLVRTLENVARELVSMLSEANSQYYDIFTERELNSNPPTPLAAPLPEYFVYETEESDIPVTSKIIIKEDAQTWIRRFSDLFKNNVMKHNVYSLLIEKVSILKDKGRKIDLQDIYKDLNIQSELKESIAFALVNKSAIEQHDVSLSDLFSPEEKARKVEKPKAEQPKALVNRQRKFLTKAQHRSFDLERKESPGVYSSIDYQSDTEKYRMSPIPKPRLNSMREKTAIKKSSIEKRANSINKYTKVAKARSITPVFSIKERISAVGKLKKPLR